MRTWRNPVNRPIRRECGICMRSSLSRTQSTKMLRKLFWHSSTLLCKLSRLSETSTRVAGSSMHHSVSNLTSADKHAELEPAITRDKATTIPVTTRKTIAHGRVPMSMPSKGTRRAGTRVRCSRRLVVLTWIISEVPNHSARSQRRSIELTRHSTREQGRRTRRLGRKADGFEELAAEGAAS